MPQRQNTARNGHHSHGKTNEGTGQKNPSENKSPLNVNSRRLVCLGVPPKLICPLFLHSFAVNEIIRKEFSGPAARNQT